MEFAALEPYVVYDATVGSRAYGLERDGSDVDVRGVYLPPADLHWSLDGVPEQIEDPDADRVYWEYEKFVRLALKSNPNILEVLWTPLVNRMTAEGEHLREERRIFVSKQAYQTYGALNAEITDAHLLFDAQVRVPIARGVVDFNRATVEHVGPDSRMGVSRMGIYVDAPNGRSYLYQFPSAPVAGAFLWRNQGNSKVACAFSACSFFMSSSGMAAMSATVTTLPCECSTSTKRLMCVPLN